MKKLLAILIVCLTCSVALAAEPVIVDVNPQPPTVVAPTTPTVRPAVERPRVRWLRRICRICR